MHVQKLQDWLDGKYVAPSEFKESLKAVIKMIGIYESAIEEDDKAKERYANEIKRLNELLSKKQ